MKYGTLDCRQVYILYKIYDTIVLVEFQQARPENVWASLH